MYVFFIMLKISHLFRKSSYCVCARKAVILHPKLHSMRKIDDKKSK